MSYFNIANSSQSLQYIALSGHPFSTTIKTNYKGFVEKHAIICKLCRHLAKNYCNFHIGAGSMSSTILVIHGPNLNLLGKREPEVYGHLTLENINQQLIAQAQQSQISLETFQSNWEGAVVDRIHQAQQDGVQFIIINPAALTHTSVAVRDALLGVAIPFIEVHLSNVHAREAFRHHSYLSDKAVGVICGLGAQGYSYALNFAISKLQTIQQS